MFASVRCYHVHRVPAEELVHYVDADFAPQITAQPGCVSYEFLNCGGGDVMSISVFSGPSTAAAARSLARDWTERKQRDFELTVTENLHGPILIDRSAPDAVHVPSTDPPFASVRRWRLGPRHVVVLRRAIQTAFPDRIASLDGFLSYRVIDCGGAGVLSISLFHDRAAAAASDELAMRIIHDDFSGLAIERTEMLAGGDVMVSRIASQRQPA